MAVSRNGTVASALKARNAAGVADVLVEFIVPDGKGMTKVQQRMTPSTLELWLKKTGNSDKAQDVWFSLMKGDRASFLHRATKVTVTAL